MKKNNLVAVCAISLLFMTIFLLLLNYEYNKKPTIENIKYANSFNNDNTRKVTIKLMTHNNNNVYCQFIDDTKNSNYILAKNDKCSFNAKTYKYTINIKYNGDKVVTYKKKIDIDGIVGIKINNKKKYIALGEG